MSNIFSKLLDEGQRQRQQLESVPTQAPKPSSHPLPQTVIDQATDITTLSRNIEEANRPSDGATLVPSDVPSHRRNDLPTKRRLTERIAFDLYQDQVQAIRRLRAQRELDGSKRVSLSDIAREAIALYLSQAN